jgi:hypothetical protein
LQYESSFATLSVTTIEVVMVIFANWREAIKQINNLTEHELIEALEFEVSNVKRWSIVERLHARLTMVRGKREREEYRRLIKGDDPDRDETPSFESLFGG